MRFLIFVVCLCLAYLAAAQTPPQTKLEDDGGVAEFRDRIIYETIAWRDLFEQVKLVSSQQAVLLRNKGRASGLYAFWEWKSPPGASETEQESLLSCRKAAQGARYAMNDYTELLLNRQLNQPVVEWEEKYRLSLSTYTREWPKCERAFPDAAKAMKKAYAKTPIRP